MDKSKKFNQFISPTQRQIKVISNGGNVDVLKKSKRENVKGLRSNLSKENSENGGFDFDEESPLTTSTTGGGKRFKFHSKPLNECNAIDHAVIPRKLRSSMTKRSRESLSPPLPSANSLHHISTHRPRINGAKKPKQEMKQRCGGANQILGRAESVLITKDEEEVAETLYALARMIPHGDNSFMSQIDQQFPDEKENPVLVAEALEENETKCHKASISDQGISLHSTVEESGSDAESNKYLTSSTVVDRSSTLGKQKLDLSLGSTSLPDLNTSPLVKTSEHTNNTQLSSDVEGVMAELCQGIRSTQARQHEPSSCEPEPDLWPVTSIRSRLGKSIVKEKKDHETLLGGLEGASALSVGDRTKPSKGPWLIRPHGGSSWLSSCKVPTWLDSSTSATKSNSIVKAVSKEKVNSVVADRKRARKRCATHVYISCLILRNRTSEKKPTWEVSLHQIKQDGAKFGAIAINSLIGPKDGFSARVSIDGQNGLTEGIFGGDRKALDSEKIMNEVPYRVLKDNQQSYCDFRTLSTCGGGTESESSTKDANQGASNFVSSAQFRVPCANSVVQNGHILPFTMQGRPSSSPYPNQWKVPTAQQLQSSPRTGSPFHGSQQLNHGDPTTHQQQQHMWAAHYNMPAANSALHLRKWQNQKHDPPNLNLCGVQQSRMLPTSSLTSRVLVGKFLPSVQQQHQIFSASPSSSIGKLHHYTRTSGYDGGDETVHLT